MATKYKVGDRVRIIQPHAPGHELMTITTIYENVALAGIIDGMESMGEHRWYVDPEVVSEDAIQAERLRLASESMGSMR